MTRGLTVKKKVTRSKSGKATRLVMTAKVGPRPVTLFQEIDDHEVEAIAILRAEAECYRRFGEMRQELAERRSRPGWPLVRDWYNHWYHERYIIARWYPATQNGVEVQVQAMWRLVEKDLGHLPMDDITPVSVNRAIARAIQDGAAKNYASRTQRMLRTMFADSIIFGWDDGYGRVHWRGVRNPMDGVHRMRDEAFERTILSDKLLRMILDRSEERHRPVLAEATRVIAIQGALGLRINEVACLDWRQVGVGDHFVVGAAGFIVWKRGRRKAGIPLRLPFPQAMLRFLPLERREREGPVWKTPARALADAVNAELKECARDLHFPEDAVDGLSSHSLRHSFANALKRADTKVADIQQALGHANIQTTMLYLRSSPDYQEAAAAVLPRAAALLAVK